MDGQINTLSWVETITMGHTPMRTQVWMRSDPPAMVRISDMGGLRQIIDAQGQRVTNDTWPYILVYDRPRPIGSRWLERSGLAPAEADDVENAAWRRSEYEDDGERLTRYERRSVGTNFEVEETIVAESDTRRIVNSIERQYEMRHRTLVSETVRDQYTYNQPAPDGTFEMPTDKPEQRHGVRQVTTEHIPPITDTGAKAEIESAIQKCEASWKHGDWAAFAALWRFSIYPGIPHETDWRQRFDKHAGRWGTWQSQVQKMVAQKHISVPVSANSFHILKVNDRVIAASCNLSASVEGGGDWQGRAEYFLQAFDNGYRIVHANIPVDEIAIACGRSRLTE